jgi:hypothetical protein
VLAGSGYSLHPGLRPAKVEGTHISSDRSAAPSIADNSHGQRREIEQVTCSY